jgi:integrase
VSSNRARTAISSFFRWAMENGLADANPVVGTKRHKEQSRERVLVDDEIGDIWRSLEGESHFSCIVKLLLLTGARATEIGSLRWSEVDLQKRTIVLPRTRTKNRREHTIPLSDMAVAILAAQPQRAERDLIFGIGQGGFDGFAPPKKKLDARIAALRGAPLKGWVIHDLRRSADTGMAEIGIEPHIIEAVINHVSGHKAGVAGRYNRATYEPQKRQALDRWAEHLRTVIEGRPAVVVPLHLATA